MKKLYKFFTTLGLLSCLFSGYLNAGLPPTTSKDSADSTNVTTFNYQFPNFTGTHTGITFSLGVNSIAGGGTGQTTAAGAFNALNPMTTTGDTLYESGTGVASRLGIGTSGQVYTVSGGVPSWQTPSGGGAAGPSTSLQFNNSGVLGGSSDLTWDGTYLHALNEIIPGQIFDNSGPTASIDPNNRILKDSGGNAQLYWDFMGEGNMAFAYPILGTGDSNESIDTNRRDLIDQFNTTSVAYNDRQLFDSSGTLVANWDSKALVQSNGVDFSLEWQSYLALDNTATQSINWDARSLFDNAGNVVVDYQNGYLFHPDVGAGRIAVVDAVDAALKNPNNGNTVFDFGNQQLYDANGGVNVDARDRELYDDLGVLAMSYQSASGSTGNQRTLWDLGGVESQDFGSRITYDSNPVQSMDWGQRQLFDSGGTLVANWDSKALVQSNGIDFSLEWQSYITRDNSATQSINWDARELDDVSGNPQIYWSHNGGGSVAFESSIVDLNDNQSLDLNNRRLHDVNGSDIIDYSNSNNGIGLFQNLNFGSNLVNVYNGDTTDGNGVTSIVKKIALTGQTSSISTTTLFTPSAPGMYTVKAYFNPANLGTAGTLAVNISWADTNSGRTIYAGSNAGGTMSLSTSTFDQGSKVIFAQGGLNHISYSTTVTGALGSPTYDLYIEVDRGT